MSAAIIWSIAFLVVLGVELLIGTFYLLMVSLGIAVGALAAWAGLGPVWQFALAGVIGIAATAGLHFKRYKTSKTPAYSENKNVLIDIGETVEVDHWDSNLITNVRYRGANWSARWAGEGSPTTGLCVISGIEGNQLQLVSKN